MYDPYAMQGYTMGQPPIGGTLAWEPDQNANERLRKKMAPKEYAMMMQQMNRATQPTESTSGGLFSKLMPLLQAGIGMIPGGGMIQGLASAVLPYLG